MSRISAAVASLTVASTLVANAGITQVGAVTDLGEGPNHSPPPWSLIVPFQWDFTTPDPLDLSWAGVNWEFRLTPFDNAGFKSLTLDQAFHNIAGSPSQEFMGGVYFPATAGSGGIAFGAIPHTIGGVEKDTWRIEVLVNSAGTGADIKVMAHHPVPEPMSFAMVAGLGLVGFGLYRRSRN